VLFVVSSVIVVLLLAKIWLFLLLFIRGCCRLPPEVADNGHSLVDEVLLDCSTEIVSPKPTPMS